MSEPTKAISAIDGPFVPSQRNATPCDRNIFYRDFFGEVLSDLWSRGSFGRPAHAVLVRARADGRKVEVYDMFRLPGTTMLSRFRRDGVCIDVCQ